MLLTPEVRAVLPVAFLNQLQAALAHSLFWVYLLALVLAAVGLATMFLLPGGRADQYSYTSMKALSTDEDAVVGAESQAGQPESIAFH